MRLAELSSTQHAQRQAVIQTLSAAGWTGRPLNDLLEKGFWLDCEATLDYTNAQAQLVLMYSAENQTLELLVDQDYRLDFVIQFGDRLPQVLKTIVAFRDRISLGTAGREMAALLQVCPSRVSIYSEDEGLVPVSPDLLASL